MNKNNFIEICRALFFKTGKIGYYVLANEIERAQELEEAEELSM